MATKNDITGDTIASRISTPMYRKGWDLIFAKKTAIEWAKFDGIVILDPDGFRYDDGITAETPISYAEYSKHITFSTVLLKKISI